MQCPHLPKHFLVSIIHRVLADFHQLTEEYVPDLGESLAHRFHQSFQDGGDIGLDIVLKDLLCMWKHQGCT